MRRTALRLGIAAAVFTCAAFTLRAGDSVKVDPDVIYGRKDGMALTLDVIRPANPNGAGILWIQSGGWYSGWTDPKVWSKNAAPFLKSGFTLFIVRHASAPKYTVPEAVEDVRRAVRFIRMKAKDYGVNPERLGALGGSAGGHLALMLATTGDDGDPRAKDAVLRQPSRIACAVALYPPTDLRGWTTDPPEEIKKIPALKPPLTFDAKKEAAVSPLLHVTSRSAPALMIHGDKDALVPIEHSKNLLAKMEKAKVIARLITIEGAGHSFTPEQSKTIIQPAMLNWFEAHLETKKST